MTNAWALAASILDGTFDEDYPVMKKEATTITPQESDEYDIPKNKDTDRITYSTDFEHSPYYYDYTRNDPDAKNPFTDAFDYAMGEAVVSGGSVPIPTDYYPSSFTTLSDNDDQIAHHIDRVESSLNYEELTLNTEGLSLEEIKETMSDSRNKYHENEILKDVEEYLSRTYNGH